MSDLSLNHGKRERRGNDRLAQLDNQIIAVLTEDHPQSVRHVFYRMTDPRLPEPVEKSDRGYRLVQARCVDLRRSGRVPYDWIADMSRRGYRTATFDDASDFLHRLAPLYRADLWRDAECQVEVWVESRSIASVLLADCKTLAVDLFPCGGFSSMSFAHAAAQQRNASLDTRPLVVLHVGDFDPAGVLIDVALERELREHLRGVALDFRRIAINEEQVVAYDLPTKPRKVSDLRSLHVTYSVEAEAMPAAALRAIVRGDIEALLPDGALDDSLEEEEFEQARIAELADSLGETS
jgi:hypothetical protein